MGIYTEAEFHSWLRYERKLSSRNESRLSLVLFALPHVEKKREARELIGALQQQIRLTDHIGWYSKGRIGLLLPATGRKGAESVCHHLGSVSRISSFGISIHSYPDDWISVGGGNGRDAEEELPAFSESTPLWKRALDIVGSLFLFLLFLPIFLLLPLYIRLVSPGPVFFHQRRVGRGRREFDFIKFRTMHVDNNQETHTHHAKDFINHDKPMTKLDDHDRRIIPGGKVLRTLGLDELPQIINVLKGEMTLVGPRPCIPYEADEYQRWHRNRFAVLPGITGLWQVNGKNELTFREMIQLDITYCENMSFSRDIAIMLVTPLAIARMAWRAFLRSRGRMGDGGVQHVESEVRSRSLQGTIWVERSKVREA